MIKNFFKFMKNFVLTDEKALEYRYLSESVDVVDLERRIRDIENHRAPFQRPYM